MRVYITLLLSLVFSSQVYAQDWRKVFDELYDEGDVYYYALDYEPALAKFEETYTVAVNHLSPSEIYEAVYAIVLTHRQFLRQEEASATIKEALNRHTLQFTYSQNAELYNYLGLSNSALTNYEEAIINFDSAFSYASQAVDTAKTGSILVNKSIALIYQGNYDEAQQLLDTASTFGIKDNNFNAFLNSVYFSVFSYKNANKSGFEYLIKAYNFAKKANNTHRYLNILALLSNYHISQNNYREGLAFLNEGLNLAKETNFIIQVARFNDNLGRLYRSLNEFELAINYYNEAIKIYEQNDSKDLVQTLKIQISDLLIQQKEYAVAEDILLELLSTNVSSLQRIYLYNSLSDIEIARENYINAKVYLDQALSEIDSNTVGYAYNIYDRYLTLPIIPQEEKIRFAVSIYQAAKSNNMISQMNAEIDLANLYEPLNQDSAFKYAYLAFDKLEERRVSTSASAIKKQLNSNWNNFYYKVAEWEVTYNGDFRNAFELFELSKSRTLFDQIYENQRTELLDPENPSSLKILELQKRIDQLYQQLNSSNLTINSDSDLMDLSQLELEYQTEIDALVSSNSDWVNLEYPSITRLDAAQDLLDNKTAYLNYGIRNEQLFLFLIKNDSEVFKTIEFENNALDSLTVLVNNFRDTIINLGELEDIKKFSAQIRKFVLDPIINELRDVEHLIISPDGPLHLLPFEALIIDDQYLIERFSVKYLPSISVYDVIEYPNIGSFDKELLALAGSGFESGDGFIGSSSQAAFATLPYSLAEIDSISNYFSNSTILKNEEVTEITFKNLALSDYRFIHLATHGNIDEQLPDQSGLILSKKIGTESLFGEDGYLNAREIAQLKIPAELVVISACNTGTGKVISGEGVMGLQRSFLTAGTSSVLVSLWNIFDRSTPVFMNNFYKRLLEFEDEEISLFDKIRMFVDSYEPELIDYKTLALQQTKIDMINHPYYNHPVHWAPFVITGK